MSDPYETVRLTVSQIQEALASENLYFAAQKLGRTPTTREALIHFIDQTCPPRNVRQFQVDAGEKATAFDEVFEPYPLREPFVCVECGQSGSCHHHH